MPHPRGPRRLDRQVWGLLRDQAPGPDQPVSPGAEGEPVEVDAVGDDVGLAGQAGQARAVWPQTAANCRCASPATEIADSSHGVGGVCSVVSIGTGSSGAMASGR